MADIETPRPAATGTGRGDHVQGVASHIKPSAAEQELRTLRFVADLRTAGALARDFDWAALSALFYEHRFAPLKALARGAGRIQLEREAEPRHYFFFFCSCASFCSR